MNGEKSISTGILKKSRFAKFRFKRFEILFPKRTRIKEQTNLTNFDAA